MRNPRPVYQSSTRVFPHHKNWYEIWEIEESLNFKPLNPDDTQREEMFASQHRRDPESHYIVPILMKPNFDTSLALVHTPLLWSR